MNNAIVVNSKVTQLGFAFANPLYTLAGLTSNGDVSLNARLFVGGDVSFNSHFYVGGDSSLNGALTVGTIYSPTITTINNSIQNLQAGGSASTTAQFTSPTVSFTGDISLNNRLFVNGDVSFNSKLFVNKDVSLNNRLFVNGDVSFNSSHFYIKGDSSLNGALTVGTIYSPTITTINTNIQNLQAGGGGGGSASTTSQFTSPTVNFTGDISLNNRLFVGGDTSLNANLFVNNAIVVNSQVKRLGFAFGNPLFVLGGLTSNSGLTITNGDILSPSLITSQRNFAYTLGYYTGTTGYIIGLQPYQLYSYDNQNPLFATVTPAANYIGNITLTTPVGIQLVSSYIQKNFLSSLWNLNTALITYQATIKKNGILWKTISTPTKISPSPAITAASFTGTLKSTSTASYMTIDYGRYLGTASISFIPDYNATGSDVYTIYLTFNIPSPYFITLTNTLTTTTYNAVRMVFNFLGGTSFLLLNEAIQFQLYPVSTNSNTLIVNSIIPLNGPTPTATFQNISGFTATDVPVPLSGLNGLIACKDAVIENNLYLGGKTISSTSFSTIKSKLAGASISVLSVTLPL